jgi:hypothetical protein
VQQPQKIQGNPPPPQLGLIPMVIRSALPTLLLSARV